MSSRRNSRKLSDSELKLVSALELITNYQNILSDIRHILGEGEELPFERIALVLSNKLALMQQESARQLEKESARFLGMFGTEQNFTLKENNNFALRTIGSPSKALEPHGGAPETWVTKAMTICDESMLISTNAENLDLHDIEFQTNKKGGKDITRGFSEAYNSFYQEIDDVKTDLKVLSNMILDETDS